MIDYGKYSVGMVIMPCYYYLGTIVPGRHNCPVEKLWLKPK